MTQQLIAVAVRENGQISPHAGRALHWQVYVADEQNRFSKAWEINLTETGCLHEWHVRNDNSRHPLHSVDVCLAGSAGEGVTQRLAERNTQLLDTAEKDPEGAVTHYLAGTLLPGKGHNAGECLHPEHHH